MDILINNPQNNPNFINTITKSFNEVVKTYEKNVNEELIEWLVWKLNIMLKKAFKGDLYAQKSVKLKGELAARTYDIVISSFKYKRVVLVIDVNKLTDNKLNTFLRTYKDNIFYTMNLAISRIPYYNLTLASFDNVTPEGKIEKFSIKNLIRVYNWNKHSNIIPGINKLMLLKWNVKSWNFSIIWNINEYYSNIDQTIKDKVNESVILPDMKSFLIDIYTILQKFA